jgi:signal transduction histidine kinase
MDEARACASVIESARTEIVARWLERVKSDVKRAGQDVHPTQLRDAIDDYLQRLAEALRDDDPADARGDAAWKQVAREHALTRVRIGFDIDQLVHEFIVLRNTVASVSAENGVCPDSRLANRLADLIEAAIAAAVARYVQARDYQQRKVEAEHVGFVTHELRNPLATAKLAAARLTRDVAPDTADAAVADRLHRSLAQIGELIDKVVMTERLGAGQVAAQVADASLGTIMEDALRAARAEAARKGIALGVHYDPLIAVRLDEALTVSALQNLVDNAVKYTDEGSVDVDVEAIGDGIEIHVRDTCPGISGRGAVDDLRAVSAGQLAEAGIGPGAGDRAAGGRGPGRNDRRRVRSRRGLSLLDHVAGHAALTNVAC